MFYFSGHGIQVKGDNYLIPSKQFINHPADVTDNAIHARQVINEIQSAGADVNLIVLDACRNPFPNTSTDFIQQGFNQMEAKRTLISYAAALGENSYGDNYRRNSIYTEKLLKAMLDYANAPISRIFEQTQSAVYTATKDSQEIQMPWLGNGLVHEFCLESCR